MLGVLFTPKGGFFTPKTGIRFLFLLRLEHQSPLGGFLSLR